ncbi:MAG: hypothetical protein RIF33_09255 [Cyclobacteriaceae bacterium]
MEKHPALLSWLLALTAFFSFQAYIYLDSDETLIDYQITHTVQTITEACLRRDSEDLIVVTVGNSLLNHGVHCTGQFEQLVASRSNRKISLFKITRSGGNFANLIQRNDLIDQLIAARPDLILIQDELLISSSSNDHVLFDSGQDFKLDQWQDQYYKLAFKNVNFAMSLADYIRDKDYCLNSTFDGVATDSINYVNNYSVSRGWNNDSQINTTWDKLKQSGVNVKILEIARPVSKNMTNEEYRFSLIFEKQLRSIRDEFLIDYWGYDGPTLPFSSFYDHAHLNQSGREQYSQWLADRLVKQLNF